MTDRSTAATTRARAWQLVTVLVFGACALAIYLGCADIERARVDGMRTTSASDDVRRLRESFGLHAREVLDRDPVIERTDAGLALSRTPQDDALALAPATSSSSSFRPTARARSASGSTIALRST